VFDGIVHRGVARESQVPVSPAFVFTLDGVLVDSEAVKLASFAEACGDVWRLSNEELETIRAYNARQRGIPRRQKFEFVHRHLVMRGDNASVSRVIERYAELLEQRLTTVSLLPGVREFLDTVPARRFVLSAGPEDEATTQLARHHIDGYFEALFASAGRKADTLRRVAKTVDGPLALFGDAPSDQVAAVTAGVRFVPVNPNDHLRPHLSEWAADFTDVASILALAGLTGDLAVSPAKPAPTGLTLPGGEHLTSPLSMLVQKQG
jgi:beta-phosphoglucomutase-like phosphatase (HAD superfamily)